MLTYPLVLDAAQRVGDLRAQLSEPEIVLPAVALIRWRDRVLVRWYVLHTSALTSRCIVADEDLPLVDALALPNMREAPRCDAADLQQRAPHDTRTCVVFAGTRLLGVTVMPDEERSDMPDKADVGRSSSCTQLDAAGRRARTAGEAWEQEVGKRTPGRVTWINDAKGFGFITPADGATDDFVHESAIRGTGIPPSPPPIEPPRPPSTAPPVEPSIVPPTVPTPPQAPDPLRPAPSVPAPAPMPHRPAPEAIDDASEIWRPRGNGQHTLDDDGEALGAERVAARGT